jgi:1-deoxy-D-xylulose-5-phosphate synthase
MGKELTWSEMSLVPEPGSQNLLHTVREEGSILPLLSNIQYPEDLRKFDRADLPEIAHQLRAEILRSVSETGGHLSSNLGTVELTLALHYVFDTPNDRIVWDVGHQTYAHKILTGRKDAMHTLRKWGGLSGFPRRDESSYDAFGTAHSSTSISAALGMAVASRARGESRRCIAVIGDGAMSAGMAFEALNNAGVIDTDLLVILNDNDMSISPAVGALNRYLAHLVSGRFYQNARELTKSALANVPVLKQFARKMEVAAKGMVMPSTLFEQFGFNYVGPIDGHDLKALIPTLQNLKTSSGPRLLHIVTKKGQGYQPAEADPVKYHGVTRFDPTQGLPAAKVPATPSYTQVFGDWLCDVADRDRRVVGITPAMREGSGLVDFAQRHPDRYFDVGIAEQHAVTFAAGVACEDMRPVVAIYSTFLQRGYDQCLHDVQLQNLPVLFALDRAGLVGADGPTHHGSFDISYLRCLPGIHIMTPSSGIELRRLLNTGLMLNAPAAVRYPRGSSPDVPDRSDFSLLPVGRAEVVREGHEIALLAFGPLLKQAREAGQRLGATVVNMRWVKPLDVALLKELAGSHRLLVTLEDHVIQGGAGSAVIEALQNMDVQCSVLQLGHPDRWIEHGDQPELLASIGLDTDGIIQAIHHRLGKKEMAA